MKQIAKNFLLILGVVFLAGCATPEHNFQLPESFWQNPKHKIVIAKTKFKSKPGLYQTGQQGLLDMVISSATAKDFDKHLKNTSLDWYKNLPQKFITELKKRHISAQIYTTDINPEQKKNSTFAIQMDGDKLLLLELQKLGATRSYYSFIPTGAPKALCVLKGELINQQDKKVLWRHLAEIEETVQGNWDQPPSYQNFTVALKQAIDAAQEEIIDSFFSGH